MCAYRPVVPIYPSQPHPSTSGASYPVLSTSASVSLKRPFRHRRKDPSCDACRERKVKCDATGTSSCTECRTRGIKCQFTREHMRRVTSMKQVQDLERKLRNAKLEVSNLQSQMQRQRLAALDDTEWPETTWRRSASDPTDPRSGSSTSTTTQDAPPVRGVDFRRVRDEIILRSPGLFNIPPAWRESVPDPVSESQEAGICYYRMTGRPSLPPRPFAEHLLDLFKNEVYAICPFVDLELFMERATVLYDSIGPRDSTGIPVDTSRSFLSLFFSFLALTATCIQDDVILQYYANMESNMPIGRDLADAATAYFGPVTKKPTLDDVRGALTLVLYYRQINELGAANLWLSASVKMAQYLGLHRYSPGLSRVEEEARAKAWWDIYLLDRILAGQQGSEMTIMDNDCDLPPPDVLFPAGSTTTTDNRSTMPSKLYSWTVVHGRIYRTLRDSSFLSQEELDKLDDRTQAQYDKMPRLQSNRTDSDTPAWYLDNQIFVHYTKLRIHRHNLIPSAPMTSRLAALRSLITFARDHSRVIASRFKDDVDPDTQQEAHDYNQRVLRIIHPEHAQFLYSCAMYLVVAKLWTALLPYIIALRAIGDKLTINRSCCRYLWGVIISTEGRDSILHGTERESQLEAVWVEEDEETVALIAAEMHQDGRMWETVWQKNEIPPRSPDISPLQEEMEMEQSEEAASAISESSEIRSGQSVGIASVAAESVEDVTPTPTVVHEEHAVRPELPHRWSGEDETWDSMLAYVRKKCEEQRVLEESKSMEMSIDVPSEGEVSVKAKDVQESERDEIQRRMSIANLL